MNLRKEASEHPAEKFELLLDLGVIIAPDDFNHSTCLVTFIKNNRNSFFDINEQITDKNFSIPTRILKPGDKLNVTVYQQIKAEDTSSKERIKFLNTLNSIFVGAQGATLVWEQKRDLLPKGKWYSSFDKQEIYWEQADAYKWIPRISCYTNGEYNFNLGEFKQLTNKSSCILCFQELSASKTT